MKTILIALAFVLVGVAQAASDPALSITEDSVKSVAGAALPALLGTIPVGQEVKYGFADRAAMHRARVGAPLAVYSTPAALADSAPDLADWSGSLPVPTGTWRVPVVVDGHARTFVTVESFRGAWEAVEIGGAMLAQEIDTFVTAQPLWRKGILRLDRLRCDVLVLEPTTPRAENERQYHPLRSSRQVLSQGVGARSGKVMFGEIHRAMRARPQDHPSPRETR